MPMLNWMGREKAVRQDKEVALKILREDKSLGYNSHAEAQRRGDNILVHGDNLEALKALLPFHAGEVKCIYIDPPYNTGSAFEHYDDNLEHSTWLNMMYPRLKLLREFLREDGSIWITLDDGESHYCKVICDEIFGRQNFLVDVIWQHSVQPKGYLDKFSIHHNHILLYRKSDKFKINPLEREEKDNKAYSNPDNDPKGLWRSGDVRNALYRPNLIYDVITPSGKVIKPCKNGWRWSKETMQAKISSGEIIFNKDETRIIRKIYLSTVEGRAPESIFFGDLVGTTREAMSEIKALFGTSAFETPKPERLIQRILTIATNPGDVVLDSFLGSGTTAAVAHKMGRRWIGIEMGEHAKTHCAVRMKKVIDGEQGGISKSVNWQGGGGFRFYELGEPLLDEKGQLSESIPYDVLAAHIWWQETGHGWMGLGNNINNSKDNLSLEPGATAPGAKTLEGDKSAGGCPPSARKLFSTSCFQQKSTVLGIHDGVAYALLYNGILHDRSVNGGNVLTRQILGVIKEDLDGAMGSSRPTNGELAYRKLVVYGEACRLGDSRLAEEKIEFRQTPYDVVTRR